MGHPNYECLSAFWLFLWEDNGISGVSGRWRATEVAAAGTASSSGRPTSSGRSGSCTRAAHPRTARWAPTTAPGSPSTTSSTPLHLPPFPGRRCRCVFHRIVPVLYCNVRNRCVFLSYRTVQQKYLNSWNGDLWMSYEEKIWLRYVTLILTCNPDPYLIRIQEFCGSGSTRVIIG